LYNFDNNFTFARPPLPKAGYFKFNTMKLFQIFNKTPNYKKFNYNPRFYNPDEEEKQERLRRVESELNAEKAKFQAEHAEPSQGDLGYRARIHGSFARARQANGNAAPGTQQTSPTLLRFGILLVLTVGLIGYLQYGSVAIYGIFMVLIPLFLYLKFRKLSKKEGR
jgi:hypothetical protein